MEELTKQEKEYLKVLIEKEVKELENHPSIKMAYLNILDKLENEN